MKRSRFALSCLLTSMTAMLLMVGSANGQTLIIYYLDYGYPEYELPEVSRNYCPLAEDPFYPCPDDVCEGEGWSVTGQTEATDVVADSTQQESLADQDFSSGYDPIHDEAVYSDLAAETPDIDLVVTSYRESDSYDSYEEYEDAEVSGYEPEYDDYGYESAEYDSSYYDGYWDEINDGQSSPIDTTVTKPADNDAYRYEDDYGYDMDYGYDEEFYDDAEYNAYWGDKNRQTADILPEDNIWPDGNQDENLDPEHEYATSPNSYDEMEYGYDARDNDYWSDFYGVEQQSNHRDVADNAAGEASELVAEQPYEYEQYDCWCDPLGCDQPAPAVATMSTNDRFAILFVAESLNRFAGSLQNASKKLTHWAGGDVAQRSDSESGASR